MSNTDIEFTKETKRHKDSRMAQNTEMLNGIRNAPSETILEYWEEQLSHYGLSFDIVNASAFGGYVECDECDTQFDIENEIYDSIQFNTDWTCLECGKENEFDTDSNGADVDDIEAYFRYQISWGGPSEEIRYYYESDKIQFWFMDRGKGDYIELDNNEYDNALELIELHTQGDDLRTYAQQHGITV